MNLKLTKKGRRRAQIIAASIELTLLIAVLLSCLSLNARIKALEEETTAPDLTPMQTSEAAPMVLEYVRPAYPEPLTPTVEPEPTLDLSTYTADPYEVELIGRTIWGEAGGVVSKAERAAVAWCILNRVDAWGKTVEQAVTAPYQFQGYRPTGECPQEHLELAADVLSRWMAEKDGVENVGRTLPSDYLYFLGDGARNHFTTEFMGGNPWNWSMADPYEN